VKAKYQRGSLEGGPEKLGEEVKRCWSEERRDSCNRFFVGGKKQKVPDRGRGTEGAIPLSERAIEHGGGEARGRARRGRGTL